MLSSVLALDCQTFWCVPTGPGTPFATPLLFVIDTFRVLVILGGGITMLIMMWTGVKRVTTHGQRERMCCLGVWSTIGIYTEISRLGDLPSVRLFLTMLGVGWSIRAMRMFFAERPARDAAESPTD